MTAAHNIELGGDQVNAKALDMVALPAEVDISEDELLPILPEGVDFKEGTDVYFAGFPLKHDKITFHKGMISSVSKDRNFREFTIDGTVVPGNSGGPVVALHNGQPHIIGMITSEMADFSPEDLITIQCMEELNQHFIDHPPQQISKIGDLVTTHAGALRKFPVKNGNGQTSYVSLTDVQIMTRSLSLMKRNLSTGVGRDVDIREYQHLNSPQSIQEPGNLSGYYHLTGIESEKILRLSLEEIINPTIKYHKNGNIDFKKENLIYIKNRYPKKFDESAKASLGKSGLHKNTSKYSINGHIESDHTIPYDVWKKTTNEKMKAIMEDHKKKLTVKGSSTKPRPGEGELPAITIPYKNHRNLLTTGSGKEKDTFRQNLTDRCNDGKVDEALIFCFKDYADKEINLKDYKVAITESLNLYQENLGLIAEDKIENIKKAIFQTKSAA